MWPSVETHEIALPSARRILAACLLVILGCVVGCDGTGPDPLVMNWGPAGQPVRSNVDSQTVICNRALECGLLSTRRQCDELLDSEDLRRWVSDVWTLQRCLTAIPCERLAGGEQTEVALAACLGWLNSPGSAARAAGAN